RGAGGDAIDDLDGRYLLNKPSSSDSSVSAMAHSRSLPYGSSELDALVNVHEPKGAVDRFDADDRLQAAVQLIAPLALFIAPVVNDFGFVLRHEHVVGKGWVPRLKAFELGAAVEGFG